MCYCVMCNKNDTKCAHWCNNASQYCLDTWNDAHCKKQYKMGDLVLREQKTAQKQNYVSSNNRKRKTDDMPLNTSSKADDTTSNTATDDEAKKINFPRSSCQNDLTFKFWTSGKRCNKRSCY
jgi:hypothetical protein